MPTFPHSPEGALSPDFADLVPYDADVVLGCFACKTPLDRPILKTVHLWIRFTSRRLVENVVLHKAIVCQQIVLLRTRQLSDPPVVPRAHIAGHVAG